MVCERERVCVCLCTFNDVPLGTSNIIQVFHFVLNFIQWFLVLNLHVKGKETCKEKFAVCYDYCLDPNL